MIAPAYVPIEAIFEPPISRNVPTPMFVFIKSGLTNVTGILFIESRPLKVVVFSVPDTVSPPSIVEVPDMVRLFWMAIPDNVASADPADKVVPSTVRLFWMVAAEAVRSPLMVVAFNTSKDDKVAAEFPADSVVPPTVRSL